MPRKKSPQSALLPPPTHRNIAVNRRATYDYAIEERLEAGLALTGSEIKSIRAGSVSLREGYVQVLRGEAFLHGVHIARYKPASQMNHDPLRPRKLLLHKAQIRTLEQRLLSQGYSVLPLRLYLSDGRAKLEIGLGRGLKRYDKRERTAEREAQRQIARHLRRPRGG